MCVVVFVVYANNKSAKVHYVLANLGGGVI